MIESIRIANFRGFQSATADSLKRVNVVVGRNASGKTSFLEAIFMTLGSGPELALRLRSWRGLGESIALPNDVNALQELWADLFFQFDLDNRVSVQLAGSKEFNRTLRISFQSRGRSSRLRPGPSGTLSVAPPEVRGIHRAPSSSASVALEKVREVPIRFDWRTSNGEFTTFPELGPNGVSLQQVADSVPAVFFHSTLAFNTVEVAARYSRLSQKNEEGRVVDALKEEFPFIRGLSVEVNGGTPMVQAQIDGMRRKVPLGLVSGGVNKLLSLLVAIADTRRGVVLVDEVENGFYFDRLPAVWRILLRFAATNDCQLFCSTHSHESISSLRATLDSNAEDFSLLRIEQSEGSHVIRQFSGFDFAAAVDQDVEVR
jgi:hypothetical protein